MNIYVGNLSFSVSETDLREAFAAYGQVATASIIKDKFSGESRGFGFVEMPTKEEAEKAIAGLNKNDVVDMGYTAVYDFGGIGSWPYDVVTE